MDISTAFENVNWLGVFIASLSTFVVGFIWYHPAIFGKIWMTENNLVDNSLKQEGGMAKTFVLTFVLSFIAAAFLSLFISKNGGASLMDGAMFGLFVSLGWLATQTGVHMLFNRKSLRAYLIHAGHDIIAYVLMGIVIAALS